MSAAKRSGWYSVEIALLCQRVGCRKGATREVFNRYNSLVGRYCTRHAEQRLNQSDKEYVPPRKIASGEQK